MSTSPRGGTSLKSHNHQEVEAQGQRYPAELWSWCQVAVICRFSTAQVSTHNPCVVQESAVFYLSDKLFPFFQPSLPSFPTGNPLHSVLMVQSEPDPVLVNQSIGSPGQRDWFRDRGSGIGPKGLVQGLVQGTHS